MEWHESVDIYKNKMYEIYFKKIININVIKIKIYILLTLDFLIYIIV